MRYFIRTVFSVFMIISLLTLPIYAVSVGDDVGVGGMAFGIKFYTDGVLICGVSDVDGIVGNVSPGKASGLKKGDIILELNEQAVNSVEDITEIVKASEGKEITIDILRNNERLSVKTVPIKSKSEGIYKLGLWIKDGTAGIGTVTYIDTDTGYFAGLGHGVCDIESGQLLKLRDGKISDVTICGIKEGMKGSPGELRGYFSEGDCGTLTSNTEHGVFGVFSPALPEISTVATIASKNDLKEGPAYILCTLDDNIISKYDIEIEKINKVSSDTKNFVVKVTDDELISRTGGIVQGMSGSPIIQNGKLVGAVTHVFVDDPQRGYGIFIENMLEN